MANLCRDCADRSCRHADSVHLGGDKCFKKKTDTTELRPIGSELSGLLCTVPHKLLVALYNTGYANGHNDTVEGCFTDVLPVDMDSYHDDIVEEWLAEHKDT